MNKQLIIAILVPATFLWLIGAGSGKSVQIANSRSINNQTVEQGAHGITTEHAFVRALVAARAPGGFVRMMECNSGEPLLHEDRVIGQLSDALQSLVKKDPGYKWQIDKGVINLLPAAGEPDLLKVRVRQYKINTDLNQAVQQLLALPEVNHGAARLGLKLNTEKLMVSPSALYGGPSRVEVDVRHITIRQALNALVRAHGRAIWEYRQYRCSGINEFSIDFLAR